MQLNYQWRWEWVASCPPKLLQKFIIEAVSLRIAFDRSMISTQVLMRILHNAQYY
jgi:hypothetical protein